MNQPYTLSTLLDDLRAIYNEHGDIPVLDSRQHDLFARHVELTKVDDWNNTTASDDGTPGEIPGVQVALMIGR